jgi:hypothetical protein
MGIFCVGCLSWPTQKIRLIFGADHLKQPVPKIPIFGVDCLRQPTPKIKVNF